jgi:hypothetical protein
MKNSAGHRADGSAADRSDARDRRQRRSGGFGFEKAGVKSMKFVCLVAAPEGITALHQQHPEVPIYCASIDRQLNEKDTFCRDLVMRGIEFSEREGELPVTVASGDNWN